MDAVGRRIGAAYDRIAADYAVRNAAMPSDLLALGVRFLTLVGPGARILDAGCGAGRDMAWLEGQGAVVTGIDLSRGMLAQARPGTRGNLVRMDLRRLALRSGRFRGVWCMASLLHVPKADAPDALRELRRVLAPGGALCLGLQEGEGEAWERVPYGTVERLFARYTPEEVEALLDRAGFTVREWHANRAGARRWLQFLAAAPGKGAAS